jgi:hypothetical protein
MVAVHVAAFPVELDFQCELILRKFLILANDWQIRSPELLRQLMPPG